MTTQRVPLLHPDKWGDDAHEAFAVLSSSATKDVGAASNLGMTLANYPKLAKAFYTFGRHLLLESSLGDRPREIATLRVAWRYKVEYEWFHHVRFGKRIGMTAAEIEAIKTGADDKVWTNAADRAVLRVTDSLIDKSTCDDATWAEINKHFNLHQVMDLLFTVGQYVMLGWVAASAGVKIEDGFDDKDHPLR